MNGGILLLLILVGVLLIVLNTSLHGQQQRHKRERAELITERDEAIRRAKKWKKRAKRETQERQTEQEEHQREKCFLSIRRVILATVLTTSVHYIEMEAIQPYLIGAIASALDFVLEFLFPRT